MSQTGHITEHDRHVPVLCAEVVAALNVRDGGTYVDGTFGAGGYSRAILEAADCKVIAIDRDPDAISAGVQLAADFNGRLILVEGRFGNLMALLREHGVSQVDGVTLDLGVSSMQLDQAERGFSFRLDGPLDMRMDQGREALDPSAAEVVNTAGEGLLVRIISVLGEERLAKAVARSILRARDIEPFQTTKQLASVIEKVVHQRPGKKMIHPATRTFQALRIYVNRELEELVSGLSAAEHVLAEGGQLAVVSFHSLEDRIVKRFIAERAGLSGGASRHVPEPSVPDPSFLVTKRSGISAQREEIAANPRSRSARLRSAERTAAPAFPVDPKALGLPTFEPFQRRS